MHPIIAEQLVSSYQDDLARARRHPHLEPGARRRHHLFRGRRRTTGPASTTS